MSGFLFVCVIPFTTIYFPCNLLPLIPFTIGGGGGGGEWGGGGGVSGFLFVCVIPFTTIYFPCNLLPLGGGGSER